MSTILTIVTIILYKYVDSILQYIVILIFFYSQEFAKIVVPPYKICKKEDYYYLVKETPSSLMSSDNVNSNINDSSGINEELEIFNSPRDQDKMRDEVASQPSDISSVNGSVLTDGGNLIVKKLTE